MFCSSSTQRKWGSSSGQSARTAQNHYATYMMMLLLTNTLPYYFSPTNIFPRVVSFTSWSRNLWKPNSQQLQSLRLATSFFMCSGTINCRTSLKTTPPKKHWETPTDPKKPSKKIHGSIQILEKKKKKPSNLSRTHISRYRQ